MPIENGDTVKVHYIGTFPDGQEFDSSRREGREPLEFVVGKGMMIPGFEKLSKAMNSETALWWISPVMRPTAP